MTPPLKLATGLVFTGCAGFIDAVGFLELGGYFTSFMSGNTTQLGVGLAHASATTPALPLALVLMFFIGGVLGSLAISSFDRWGQPLVLAIVIGTVIVAILLSLAGLRVDAAMLPLAIGAGAQNALLPPSGAARLGATFVTGTLFAAAQDLARTLRRSAPPWRWLQHLMVWGSLCGGAALGAWMDLQAGIPSLMAPTVIYGCFLAAFIVRAAQAVPRTSA